MLTKIRMKRVVAAAGLVAILAISGCLTIQKRTLVIFLPEDSNEIQLYYCFAGFGVTEEEPFGTQGADQAKKQLAELAKDGFGFFVQLPPDTAPEKESSSNKELLAHLRFGKLRPFNDPAAKRSLCADRRVTIADRKAFVASLNKMMKSSVKRTAEEIRRDFAMFDRQLSDENITKIAEGFGAQPLLEVAVALNEIAKRLDDASLELIGRADGFEIIRLRPGSIIVVLRCTKDWAKQYAADPHAKKMVEQLEKLVKPLAFEAVEDGLALVVGKPGSPIILTFEEKRTQNATHDPALAEALGNPKPVMIDGKPATSSSLIQQFIDEQKKPLSPR